MLPFLKNSKEASVSAPVDAIKRKSDDEEPEYDSLESAVQELFDACKASDIKAGCVALRSAFQILESDPHEEGPHT